MKWVSRRQSPAMLDHFYIHEENLDIESLHSTKHYVGKWLIRSNWNISNTMFPISTPLLASILLTLFSVLEVIYDINMLMIDGNIFFIVWLLILECEYRVYNGTRADDVLWDPFYYYYFWVASIPPFQMKYILIIYFGWWCIQWVIFDLNLRIIDGSMNWLVWVERFLECE